MLLKEILEVKGHNVLSIAPSATVADVVETLVAHNCGALVVCDGDQMVGIISERDVLRAVSSGSDPLDQVAVETRMTRDVITGSPNDNINDIMGLMTKNRIRHLPVLEDGALAGMISIGDIVKFQHQKLTVENHMLMTYIQS
jgi:CBS domain-containing protein